MGPYDISFYDREDWADDQRYEDYEIDPDLPHGYDSWEDYYDALADEAADSALKIRQGE